MRAEIIAVGSELLSPTRPETNSLFLTLQLHTLGVQVARKFVVGDDRAEIAEAVRLALRKAEIVILTGGLGPTNDDLTREAVAGELGLPLREDPELLQALQRRYGCLGIPLTENNRRQARVPQGAEVIPNPHGTAPGLLLREEERLIFLLPGPPRELEPMVREQVLQRIQAHKKVSPRYSRQLKVAGFTESALDARIESIYQGYPDIETTILASPGVIHLFFLWKGRPREAAADRKLEELCHRIREELREAVFTDQEESLAEVVGRLLRKQGKTLSVAESCTGGWLAKLITDVPGSSEYFLGGIVAYDNRVKHSLLGVERRLIERAGAVSEEVAAQMAEGILRRTGSDLALSITGIAGPTGGSEEKPVGTVCMGLSGVGDTQTLRQRLPGNRENIRLRSAQLALDWLRRALL